MLFFFILVAQLRLLSSAQFSLRRKGNRSSSIVLRDISFTDHERNLIITRVNRHFTFVTKCSPRMTVCKTYTLRFFFLRLMISWQIGWEKRNVFSIETWSCKTFHKSIDVTFKLVSIWPWCFCSEGLLIVLKYATISWFVKFAIRFSNEGQITCP